MTGSPGDVASKDPAMSWLAQNLCCPCCRGLITPSDGSYRCADSKCGREFPLIHGQPVLIDFQQSVADEQQIRKTSTWLDQPQPSAFRTEFRKLLWGTNEVAERHAKNISNILSSRRSPVLLVVGGGAIGSGSECLYRDERIQTIGFDIYASKHTQFVADAHQIPLRDSSVDAVWVQAVLEHVVCPDKVVAEIYRVLKPEGIVYSDTPFLQQVHGAAWDFTRFTESGHRWMFRQFEQMDSGVVAGPGAALVSSIRYAAWGVTRSSKLGGVVAAAFSWLRLLDRLIPESFASDAASSFFFLGRKAGKPLNAREIIRYYRGQVN